MLLKKRLNHLIWLALLLFLWVQLIRQLSVEWYLNAQYGFGWAVPFLCAYLFSRDLRRPGCNGFSRARSGWQSGAALALALCYAPIRLIQEANPDWRLVSWALAVDVLGLTWLAGRLALRSPRVGTPRVSTLAFFLVAVPWPTPIEQPVIRALTGAMANGSAAIVGLLGVPALAHGTAVETGSGLVGIDEGCSGIRSFQASLMIALFFGEFYRLSTAHRALSVAAAFGVSLVFNLLRTTLLILLAAKGGYLALARWHDRAGLTILLACFGCTWLLAYYLRPRAQGSRDCPRDGVGPTVVPPYPAQAAIGWCLAGVLLSAELGTEAWYRIHERGIAMTAQWRPVLKRDSIGFCELGFPASARQVLRFTEGINATWQEENGARWQAIYLRWNPSRVAPYLARNHTPDDCLPAAGHQLVAASDPSFIEVHGLHFPFRSYIAQSAAGRFYVFYCLWEDQAVEQTFAAEGLSYHNRLIPVMTGHRNRGQRSLELALWGADNASEAEVALRRLLPKLIEVQN